MVQRFGSREICDVTFKALNDITLPNGKVAKAGQPVFVIDTAQTSNMEQASTVVYAQGGRGYNRLIAWEGEKTMTFNVTDALMSPMGLSMLTNAGIIDSSAEKPVHIHTTIDGITSDAQGTVTVDFDTLIEELGLSSRTTTEIFICNDGKIRPYATVLDHNGGVRDWMNTVSVTSASPSTNVDDTKKLVKVTKETNGEAKFTVSNVVGEGQSAVTTYPCPEGSTTPAAGVPVKLDFYVVVKEQGVATHITIEPNDFGGTFYVEADTLYRNEDGKDMAATITFPKVKINSAFTITMAANGDPSTFDFQMDAMPGYTYFDRSKKVVCDIAIVGGSEEDTGISHTSNHSGE